MARAERLTPDQLEQIYITGLGRIGSCRCSTFASLRTTTEPRELKKFQQLNAVRIQGVIPPPVPLDQALTVLEDEARKILPQGFTIDYAGESRQLRTEGGKFLGTFLLSAILIYLVLAAQFESFRDPFIVLAGSVPLAVSGALLFSFLGFTTLNIYSQVGLITLVGLVSKNGILIVQFANHLQETGTRQARRRHRSRRHAAAADPDDHRGDRRRSLPAGARHRPRRRRAQQHRHHAGQRHDHRHGVHAVRGAVDLHAAGADARGRARSRRCIAPPRCANSRKPSEHRFVDFVGRPSGRPEINAMNRRPFQRAIMSVAALGSLFAGTPALAQAEKPETLQLTLEDAVRRAVETQPRARDRASRDRGRGRAHR